MVRTGKSRFASLSNPEILALGREIASSIADEISKVVYGPELSAFVDILILALFADGHVIVRAPVGLAKTLTCRALARTIDGRFARLQFLPDLLPSQITGYDFFNQRVQEYEVRHGPLHVNILIADEINRGTPKTQAALLEAMEEKQVTVGNQTFQLPRPFLVLATRNPLEHEGTFELPEAQLDRFFAQAVIRDISEETEIQILADQDYWRPAGDRLDRISPVAEPEEILAVRDAIFSGVRVDSRLDRYIVGLRAEIMAHKMVKFVSPRRSINLRKAAQVAAFRDGREYAEPADLRYAVDILAHGITMEPEFRYAPDAPSPADIVREVMGAAKFQEVMDAIRFWEEADANKPD